MQPRPILHTYNTDSVHSDFGALQIIYLHLLTYLFRCPLFNANSSEYANIQSVYFMQPTRHKV